MIYNKVCPICHTEFIATNIRKKYCCYKCASKSYKTTYRKAHELEIKKRKKDWYEKNKDEVIKKVILYTHKNRHKINKRMKDRFEFDADFKLSIILRHRVYVAIKMQYGIKAKKTMDLIGCTVEQCRHYIESLWTEGMSWENHGSGSNKWHIDHIRPCTSFDLTSKEEQQKCFHYSNLQPLWEPDNLKKGSKYASA